jgi:predicted nucleotidyltransferase
METQIKRAIRAGNSSAVILPRAWLNKEVRVELLRKTNETMLTDVLEILKKNIAFDKIIGIYLVGSYARGEEDDKSDIDILVITKDIDKKMIREGIYDILTISLELLKQKLEMDLFPIGQMIKEAKSLLNSNYLDSIEVNITKKNTKWYIETTKDKLDLIEKILDEARRKKIKNLSDRIAYTLVLRIRTLYIINELVKKRSYSKNDLIKIINAVSKGTNSYNAYLAIKDNLEDKYMITLDETERLYQYLKNQLEEIRRLNY